MVDNTESTFITNFETAVTNIGTLGIGHKLPNQITGLSVMQANLG